ncbi:MAG: hypothetical protein ABJ059_16665, partial [Hyphomicrobiales bacterium]
DPCWLSLSRTRRTARSRTSAENLFVVLLMVLHPTQELEPPANPGRFTDGCCWGRFSGLNTDPFSMEVPIAAFD